MGDEPPARPPLPVRSIGRRESGAGARVVLPPWVREELYARAIAGWGEVGYVRRGADPESADGVFERGGGDMNQDEERPLPHALIDAGGKPAFGIYYRPLTSINLGDFDYRRVAPFPLSLSARASRAAIKRWQYMGLASSAVVAGMAVVDIGYARTAFVYAYTRGDRQLHEYSYIDLGRRRTRLSESSLAGVSEYVAGQRRIRMDNRLERGPRQAEVRVPGALRIEVVTDERAFTPLCAVTRDGLHGYNYCHKAAGFPISGFVEVSGKRLEFDGQDAFGTLDWTAGCLGRNTSWNWASGGGLLEDGRRLGINFASGVNDRGFTENVFWVDGRPVKVDVVDFDYDRDAMLTRPWRIRSNDGKADLSFRADSERAENIHLGLLVSRFHQPFGRFEGRLEIDGVMQDVGLYGMVEEHQSRW